MSEANVSSVDAIDLFRAALLVYMGKAKPVLYIGHLDVVEALREDWNYDPFTLTEKDGWLYGRGTIDMKGQDAAVAATLIEMKRAGFVPDRDIIAAFTADEESTGSNGVDFLLRVSFAGETLAELCLGQFATGGKLQAVQVGVSHGWRQL